MQLVDKEVERVGDDYRRTLCAHAAAEASQKVYDDHNPLDGVGGMSQNPYHPERLADKAAECKQRYLLMQEIREFTWGLLCD